MTTKYTRFALVVPADYPDDLVPVEPAFDVLCRDIKRLRDWMVAETGYTITIEQRIHRSQRTARELGGDNWHEYPGAPLGGVDVDWDVMLDELDRLGWEREDERRIAVVLNGGGHAGGGYDPRRNCGQAVCGDWGLTWDVLGRPDAGCAYWRGAAACSFSQYRALRHELGHAFGVDTHMEGSGWLNTGDAEHMLPEQRKQLFAVNGMFLYKPPGAEPPEPEPPTDVQKLAAARICLSAAQHATWGEVPPAGELAELAGLLALWEKAV